jgi:LysR family glycine cleavage system transcriptional activator
MRALSAFEASARHLSFLQAAAELHVTPGAVSRQIQALESLLGRPLFVRHHKRVELTRTGRDYLEDIRAPLSRIGEATARVQGADAEAALSICAYPTFAIRWFIPRWGRFYDRNPGLDVRLTTSLTPVDFERDEYDLAIQVAETDAPPPGHGEPRPRDWARWLETAGVEGVEAEKGLHFESLNLAIQAAIEGLGVAIGIEALVREDLAEGRLIQPFAPLRRSRRAMHLLYPEAKAANPNLRAFRDWLLGEVG